KFTERGSVRVRAEMAGDSEVRISVSDTGIGIAPGDLESIFQDFVQIDNAMQRRVKGTGLGLPLSRKLATILGRRVEVQSAPGAGSTFTLCIPPRLRREEEAPAQVPEFVPEAGQPVLFIEDSRELLMAYRSWLQNSEFQFVAARSTREAQDLLR